MSSHAEVEVPKRAIGTQGLVASAQGLGMNKMFSPAPEEEEQAFLATIERALQRGVNFFDTAWSYVNPATGATSEALLGKAIAKFGREKFVIATKFGMNTAAGGYGSDSSPDTIRKQLQDSLERLGVDYIDLYYQHRVDPNTPMETVMQVLKEFIDQGKIKYIGLSECTAQELRQAHAIHPITAIQMEYSLFTRDIEAEILPTARELGVAVVCYFPLGIGMLTSAIKTIADLGDSDFRKYFPRFSGENFDANLATVNRLAAIAERKGCTTAQLALAWLHAQGEDVFPIPGTTKPHRIDENTRAAVLNLTPEEVAEISAAVPEAQGQRSIDMTGTWNARA